MNHLTPDCDEIRIGAGAICYSGKYRINSIIETSPGHIELGLGPMKGEVKDYFVISVFYRLGDRIDRLELGMDFDLSVTLS